MGVVAWTLNKMDPFCLLNSIMLKSISSILHLKYIKTKDFLQA